MVPLAARDFLLVNHEGNKTDKKERRDLEKKEGGRFSDFRKCSDKMEALSYHEVTRLGPHLVALPKR